MKATTSDRLKFIMESRNLRQADILEMIAPYCERYNVSIPRNALSQYVTGKVLPRQDKLTILGMALNVSEAWLMGFDVPMERKEPAAQDEPQRNEFIQLYSHLSPEQRQIVLGVMRGFLGSPSQSNAPQD